MFLPTIKFTLMRRFLHRSDTSYNRPAVPKDGAGQQALPPPPPPMIPNHGEAAVVMQNFWVCQAKS